jgi:putative heme-binding domain-containing protein
MRRVVAMSACVVLVSSFAALSARSGLPQTADARVAAGKAAYDTSCGNDYCHGPQGEGGGAPSLRERRYTSQFLTRVIADGVPSTPMPGFSRKMTPDEIAHIVAYVLTLTSSGAPAASGATADQTRAGPPFQNRVGPPVQGGLNVRPERPDLHAPTRAGEVRGDPAAGRAIFFDAGQTGNCRFCHTVAGRGGDVGPDLSKVATKPPRDLFLSIVAPRADAGSAFAAIAVTMKDGQRFVGVKRDETADALRLYDTSSVPPVLRSLRKANVSSVDNAGAAAMPGDYASRYSLQQLLDLVAFVKSMDPASQAGVTLKDIF